MAKFIPFDDIRNDFDGAMKRMGYVRVKERCEEWGITAANFREQTRDGWYKEDTFIVNGVRYISVQAKSPAEAKKEYLNGRQ